jgi:hypothetical protein
VSRSQRGGSPTYLCLISGSSKQKKKNYNVSRYVIFSIALLAIGEYYMVFCVLTSSVVVLPSVYGRVAQEANTELF